MKGITSLSFIGLSKVFTFFILFFLSFNVAATGLVENMENPFPVRYSLPNVMRSVVSSKIFFPSSYNGKKKLPLVVVLHGCTQSANEIAGLSKFNQLAEKEKFIVLYPEQSYGGNIKRCWNWFQEEEQKGLGETAEIINLIDRVKAKFKVDEKKVFVTGLSAGGAMTSILLNCYPNYFSAGAIHSGPSYLSGTGISEAYEAMDNGSIISLKESAKLGYRCAEANKKDEVDFTGAISLMVLHGKGDEKVTPKFLKQNLLQIAYFNDWLDDGRKNRSYSLGRVKSQDIENKDGSYKYSIKIRSTKDSKMVYVNIDTMGHMWSGGSSKYRHGDPKGPDATKLIWDLFSGKIK